MIYKTYDYEMFKRIPSNRPLNERHILRLMESFSKNYLISPMIVNEKHEVIDGQNRLEAAKRMGLPVYYSINSGYGEKEIRIYNDTQKPWDIDDTLYSEMQKGNRHYLMFNSFRKKYPGFPVNAYKLLLGKYKDAGGRKHSTLTSNDGGKIRSPKDIFKGGLFEVSDYTEAEEVIKMVLDASPYYKDYKRLSFIRAMMHCKRHPDYKHHEFMYRLKTYPKKMKNVSGKEEYIDLINEIQNFKNKNKVSLKYLPK